MTVDVVEKMRQLVQGRKTEARCDFCAKWQHEVKGMVRAEHGPTICNECVGLAVEILTKAGNYP